MENFLLGLQVDFPSTISTVYRYGTSGRGGGGRQWGAPAHPLFTSAGQVRS